MKKLKAKLNQLNAGFDPELALLMLQDAGYNVDYKLSKDKEWFKYLLLDPQTSGGLLCSIDPNDSEKAIKDLSKLDLESGIIGEIIEKKEKSIYIFE